MPPLQPVLPHTPAVCPTPPPPACFEVQSSGPCRPSSISGSSDREGKCHRRTGSAGQENRPPCSTPCHTPPLHRQLDQPRPTTLFNQKPPEPPRGMVGRQSPEERRCSSGQAPWSDFHEERSNSYIPPPADLSASCFRSSASYSPPANRALGQGRQTPSLLAGSNGQAKAGASHEAPIARSPAPPGPVLNPVLFNRTGSGSQSPMAAGGPGTQPRPFKAPASHSISIQPVAGGCIAIGQPCAGMHPLVGPPKFSMGRNQSYLPSPMRLGATLRNSSLNVPLYAMPCA